MVDWLNEYSDVSAENSSISSVKNARKSGFIKSSSSEIKDKGAVAGMRRRSTIRTLMQEY